MKKLTGRWENNPHASLPEEHDWVEEELEYQYKCKHCGLVLFKRKYALGGGWGISCSSEVQGEPNTPKPTIWAWFIPKCV